MRCTEWSCSNVSTTNPEPPPRLYRKQQDVKSPLSDLLAAVSDTITTTSKENSTAPAGSQREGEQAQVEEIAFGPTPAYCLSKAAANAAVRTWAPCIQVPRGPAEALEHSESRTGVRMGGVRLVAVCPGDVVTRMTSKVRPAPPYIAKGGVNNRFR